MNTFEFNIISLIDTIALTQGVFIGILLLFRKNNVLPSVLIGLFIIFNSFELIPSIFIDTHINTNKQRLLFLPLNFYYLSLPLLYLYTQSIISELRWKRFRHHLIPGILEFVIFSILFLADPTDGGQHILSGKMKGLLSAYFVIGGIYSLYYIILIIRLTHKHKNKILNYLSSTENYLLMWIKQGSIGYLLLLLLVALYYFIIPNYIFFMDILISLLNAAVIYWFSYKALMQRYIKMTDANLSNSEKETPLQETSKEIFSPIDATADDMPIKQNSDNDIEDNISLTIEQIDDYIQKSNCYLRYDLTIFDIAIGLDKTIREVSTVINKATGQNFNTHINRFRIRKSKILLMDQKYSKLSLEGIGFEVGFRSKSAFYRAFKQFENSTPGQFNPNR